MLKVLSGDVLKGETISNKRRTHCFFPGLLYPYFITYVECIHKNLSFFSHVNNNIQLNGAKHNNVIIIYHVTYNIYIYIYDISLLNSPS